MFTFVGFPLVVFSIPHNCVDPLLFHVCAVKFHQEQLQPDCSPWKVCLTAPPMSRQKEFYLRFRFCRGSNLWKDKYD